VTEILKAMRSESAARRLLTIFCALILVIVLSAGSIFFLLTYRVKGDSFYSNGVRIYYTVEGRGEPVVLLHGFAVNADLNWRRLNITNNLAENFLVISMDLRGHGLSDKPHSTRDYGMGMVYDVVNLLDHLQIKKAHVVGYSLGGFITLKLAATHPERLITAAVLGAGWERIDNEVFAAALKQIDDALTSDRPIGLLTGSFHYKEENPGMFLGWLYKIMTEYLNDKHALISVVRAVPELTLSEEELQGINVPICSIVGSRDPLRIGAEEMVGRVPDHTLVMIDRANHITTLLHSETLDALREFLQHHKWIRRDEYKGGALSFK
jgi:pimeloyl-ACP methyl ester carboxylesterase